MCFVDVDLDTGSLPKCSDEVVHVSTSQKPPSNNVVTRCGKIQKSWGTVQLVFKADSSVVLSVPVGDSHEGIWADGGQLTNTTSIASLLSVGALVNCGGKLRRNSAFGC